IIDLYPLARKIKRHFVLHIGETNSGKTYEAIEALKKSKKGIYLAPLRLLAFEQFDNLNNNRCPCNLITGEEHILVDNAKYQSSTIEMLDMLEEYDVAVIDEAQMLEDKFRGGSWTQAILGIRAHEIHVCAAPKAEYILTKMILSCNDTYDIVKHERNTQLIQENELFEFPKDVQKGDALIVFSRTSAHGVANELKNNGIKTSIIYGSLPYDVRQNEAKRFMNGETDVVVATDAIGLGMNLPIRRVVFLEQEKYDGEKRRYLNVSEVTQIAGRAGRYGIFNEGYVNFYNNQKVIYRLLDKKTDDIKECYIGFPESLIGIDAPLSDILKRWKNVNIQDGFKKANIDHELKLVEEADKLTSDKSVIYRFITMPFDDNDSVMMWLWHTMIDNYCKGIHLDFSSLKYKYIKDRDIKDMKSMEEAYKICDMIFCYDERFFNGIDSEEIMKTKHELSEIIIGLLEQSKLSVRKCKHCGKILPWNYPYNMCQECHDIKYSHNYYDYY
ncbi:MAG: helicase, partial [Clostridiales bacterium]|nr:helicase [Clostridiales bacterium]